MLLKVKFFLVATVASRHSCQSCVSYCRSVNNAKQANHTARSCTGSPVIIITHNLASFGHTLDFGVTPSWETHWIEIPSTQAHIVHTDKLPEVCFILAIKIIGNDGGLTKNASIILLTQSIILF